MRTEPVAGNTAGIGHVLTVKQRAKRASRQQQDSIAKHALRQTAPFQSDVAGGKMPLWEFGNDG